MEKRSIKRNTYRGEPFEGICRRESGSQPLYLFRVGGAQGGYEQIAGVFLTTADQEKEHAERFFKFLEGGQATIHEATYPAGRIATTPENLFAAAQGEHEEWDILYSNFGRVARRRASTR